MNELIDLRNQDFTFIGKHGHIEGNLYFFGNTKIAGTVHGEIKMKNKSPLGIEPSGLVKGTIYCHDMVVYGQIIGNIISTGKVIFHSTSQLNGQIEAKSLVIHPGSNINMTGKTTENPTQLN